MKRIYGDRAGWARIAEIAEHGFIVAQVETRRFRGIASLDTMARVHEPLSKPVAGQVTVIAVDGFRWLRLSST